jgi:hypothetical protein
VSIFIESISKTSEPCRLLLAVRVDSEATRVHQAEYDDSNEGFKSCMVEQELFMRLSNLAHERYCNCAIYQMEMMGTVGAFVQAKPIPEFPIELGTTKFGLRRPGKLKICFDRLRSPFYHAWGMWKYRRLRRENKLRYGTAKKDSKA